MNFNFRKNQLIFKMKEKWERYEILKCVYLIILINHTVSNKQLQDQQVLIKSTHHATCMLIKTT